MIQLDNGALAVHILDPLRDRNRLGPRFSTGGYVYQVKDPHAGDLLSGPEFPADNPSVINGQGIPEVFQFTLYTSEDEIPEKKLIIGVGLVENSARRTATQLHFDARVEEFCTWEVETGPAYAVMETIQHYGHWSLRLRKGVRLEGRTLSLSNALTNIGEHPFPYRWFAHPFFPLLPDNRCSFFPPEVELPENPGFTLGPDGLLAMKRDADWTSGHFVIANVEKLGRPLHVRQLHPGLGIIDVQCSFVPSKVAVWANDRTCSIEPFTLGELDAGQSADWEITYTFGESGQ